MIVTSPDDKQYIDCYDHLALLVPCNSYESHVTQLPPCGNRMTIRIACQQLGAVHPKTVKYIFCALHVCAQILVKNLEIPS